MFASNILISVLFVLLQMLFIGLKSTNQTEHREIIDSGIGNQLAENSTRLNRENSLWANSTSMSNMREDKRKLLARHFGLNAVMTSFIYSLSIVPLFLAITSLFTPWPHGFNGRYKRALVNESHIYRHLPLMNRDETKRFLSLFETTLMNKKIVSTNCKKYYSCKVFRDAIRSRSFPKLPDFEYALLNVFGIVAERYDYKMDFVSAVKMYYEIATNALKGLSCSHLYPCSY